ncbi:MAG: LemA family protein [Selenomonadales bacterium]|nr:LemA family protein [Selenomonadales bacterium]
MNQSGRILGVLLVVLGVLALLGISLVGSYNSFVRLSQQVDSQFANLEARLQRRFDLIPNLVETVRGHMAHEQEVFGNIAEARARMAGARTVDERVAATNQLEGALSRLLVVMENYPQLKAQESVARLMDELAGTENRIAVERDNFNAVVQQYNTRIKSFPAVILANMFGYEPRTYFQADPGAQQAPRVTFP